MNPPDCVNAGPLIFLLLVAGGLAIPGCVRPQGEGEEGAATTISQVADSSTLRRESGPSPTLDSTIVDRAPDSVSAPPPASEAGTVPQDTLLARIRMQIQELQEENDSLRMVLGTLLTHLGPDAEADDAPAAQEGESSLIPVDPSQVRHWGLRSVWALVVLVLTGLVLRGLVWILDRLAERGAKRRLFYKRMVPIVRILLWTISLYLVVRVIFQVDARGVLAAAAAIGGAVGFAAQDILKNIFGGLILVFDQPFQVGDKISVGGTFGEVVSIGLRSTRLVTPDDNLVTVPNAQVVDGQVANANAGQLSCQVVTDLYLPGSVDEARAKQIAYEAAASSRYVFLNKPIVVLVKDEFKETFITHLKVKAYVMDPRYEFLLQSDITERARAQFRWEGITKPTHGMRAYVDLSAYPEPAEGAGKGDGDRSEGGRNPEGGAP
jgi:small-conductance mechanosensitive channel